MTLSYSWPEWAALCGGRLERTGLNVPPPRGVGIDSRTVKAGDLFVALKGDRQDGHDFLKEAAARGAAGAVVSRPVENVPDGLGVIRVEDTVQGLQAMGHAHRKKMAVRVIGITGSNGKTTTKEMLAHLLRGMGRSVFSTQGNRNSQIGLPLMLLELEPHHTHAVLEMGASAKGDIARLCEMAMPQMAVITGIGRAHLETFGSLEGVADAKWELVEALGKDGIAFLNGDDPFLSSRAKRARCSVVTFGQTMGADVRAENVRQDPRTVFDLVVGGARREVRLPLAGLFNVTNALAAAAVALWERGLLPTVAEQLGRFSPPPQRMQMRRRPDGSLFLIDAYNANPDSMAASLASFVSAFPQGSKTVVLGSMLELGPASEQEHRRLGRALAGMPLERLYFVGPEGPWVRSGYVEAGGKKEICLEENREKLRSRIAAILTPEAVLLFKASRGVRLEDVYEPLLFLK
jgi:UDP-N-acetylmuramoyl-tripeptide--D-alanyl-D-alanine ligase